MSACVYNVSVQDCWLAAYKDSSLMNVCRCCYKRDSMRACVYDVNVLHSWLADCFDVTAPFDWKLMMII